MSQGKSFQDVDCERTVPRSVHARPGGVSIGPRRVSFRRSRAAFGKLERKNGTHDSLSKRLKAVGRASTKAEANSISRRYLRRSKLHVSAVSQTPSEAILSALGSMRHAYAPPFLHRNKVDLSYHDPMSISRWGRGKPQPTTVSAGGFELLSRTPKDGLKSLLARYIRCTQGENNQIASLLREPSSQPQLEKKLLQVFNDDSMALLKKHGYGVDDVDFWAWILTARSSDLAALRLWTLTNAPDVTKPRAVPDFIFHLVLRRKDWNARSLKLMILYAWSRVGGSKVLSAANATPPSTTRMNAWSRNSRIVPLPQDAASPDIGAAMVIFVRLLRHARKIYPEASVSVASLLVHHLSSRTSEARTKPMDNSSISRLTFLFNSALSLLSRPASMQPFLSNVYQQRAQFRLLRSMNEFDPPLAIDREGYRAVTRVQLAHKKTIRERDWASLKARSWPPWKEDRLGLDTQKGPEYGISRAGESMLRAKEAGYADQIWEDSAEILAGWDTDRSPTIQKRTLLSAPILSRRAGHSKGILRSALQTNVWAARIRATRTVDEAWACFMTYSDESGPRSQDVHYAMFEKLVFEEQRQRTATDSKIQSHIRASEADSEIPLPGDSLEVYEKPGPREAIFVRTSPPKPNEFLQLTLRAGIRPSGRFLAFMLKHANSFQSGLWYLRESALPPRVVNALFSQDAFDDARLLADIGYMTEHTFAAFIQFLCRFSPKQSHRYLPVLRVPTKHARPGHLHMTSKGINPLLQAFRLLLARKPFYRPPWNALLSAFARAGTNVGTTNNVHAPTQDILAWNHTRTVLRKMGNLGIELDFAGFQIVCVTLEKGIFAAARSLASANHNNAEHESLHEVKQLLEEGLPFVKGLFKRLVSDRVSGETGSIAGSGDLWPAAELLPRLLEVPSPAHLHAFIRVLGLREDHAGIQALVGWMSQFAPELQVMADEAMNGRRLLRRCLVAARVFLEQSWAAPFKPDQHCRSTETETNWQDNQVPHEGDKAGGKPDVILDAPTGGHIQRVYEIVQKQEGWGGWPTDEEVEAYCRRKGH